MMVAFSPHQELFTYESRFLRRVVDEFLCLEGKINLVK